MTEREFGPGANVLVVDQDGGDALPFCLDRLGGDGRLVVSTDLPAGRVVPLAAERGEAPLHVLDATGDTDPSVDAGAPGASVTVTGPGVAAVGEAAVAALDEADGATGVCVDSVATLVARSSVQQAYKLLYVLAQRVRGRGHRAFYTWEGPAEARTLRVLGRALDYRVSLDGADGPAVRSLAGVGDDG